MKTFDNGVINERSTLLQVPYQKPDWKFSAYVRGPHYMSTKTSKDAFVKGASTVKLENSTFDSRLLNDPSRILS